MKQPAEPKRNASRRGREATRSHRSASVQRLPEDHFGLKVEPNSLENDMKFILRLLGGFVLVVVLVVAGFLIGARFADGPLAIIAGGAFTTGDPYTGTEPDWTFAKDIDTIEFQSLEPVRSRTTWSMTHEGRIFIPCGYMTTTWGRIWKQWPIEAEKDGRVIARIEGKLYDRTLVRITEGEILEPILAELGRKYAGGEPMPLEAVTSGYLWIFEMAPRA